jgi:hypothetical protein
MEEPALCIPSCQGLDAPACGSLTKDHMYDEVQNMLIQRYNYRVGGCFQWSITSKQLKDGTKRLTIGMFQSTILTAIIKYQCGVTFRSLKI